MKEKKVFKIEFVDNGAVVSFEDWKNVVENTSALSKDNFPSLAVLMGNVFTKAILAYWNEHEDVVKYKVEVTISTAKYL